jgi:general secretion pathway protein F
MRYRIKAADAEHQVVVLEVEAASSALAHDAACAQGYSVLASQALGLPWLSLPRASGAFSAALFSIELLALLEAGMNLVEALQTLAENESGAERKLVLAGMLDALYRGESFSRAIARYPEQFPALYVATVAASEKTGDVKEALERYVAYETELDRVRKQIVSASIYPAVLLVVGALVFAFLTFYVMPRFARVYEDISGNLPFFSRLLLGVGRIIEAHGWAAASAGAAGLGLAAWALSLAAVRAWLNEKIWRLPGLGERMKIYQLARLYRSLGMLLRAGIPVAGAIGMVPGLLALRLREPLGRARSLIEEGKAISTAFTSVGLATPVATRLMLVGERGGRMGETMERISRFYDDDTARFVVWFTRLFEPVLMAVLGIAVGIVVVLMYMPVFELASSLE